MKVVECPLAVGVQREDDCCQVDTVDWDLSLGLDSATDASGRTTDFAGVEGSTAAAQVVGTAGWVVQAQEQLRPNCMRLVVVGHIVDRTAAGILVRTQGPVVRCTARVLDTAAPVGGIATDRAELGKVSQHVPNAGH